MDSDFGSLILVMGLIVLLHFRNFVGSSEPQVPCYFIFGDSFVDSGNNNLLETKWKSNYPPYGVDFPEGHTGRFTNGRTFVDIIGQLLGFNEFIPPHANASDDEISKGVNYASGGAGIREETGIHNGDRISLDRQLLHHNSTISRISRIQKNTTFLNECIYVINIGSSDYINNYLMTGKHYNTRLYKEAEYANVLMQQYSRQLRTLYNLGGRKIALFGVTQLGCSPFIIERFKTQGQPCAYIVNDCAYVFNNRLKPLVDELNKDKSDARFTFINTTSILYRQKDANVPPTSSPVPSTAVRVTSATTKYLARPCCPIDGDWACIQNSVPCPTRSSSTYFDSVHLTEVSNMALATRAYKALLPTDAYPYDIHRLTQV